MSRILILGKRYKLEHGYGVLLGKEGWIDYRGPNERTYLETKDLTETPNSRFVFMLEKGHSWACGSAPYDDEQKKYCSWSKEIQEIDDER